MVLKDQYAGWSEPSALQATHGLAVTYWTHLSSITMIKLASLALAFALCTGTAQAAMFELDNPFPKTCYGVLTESRDVEDGKLIGASYFLNSEDENASSECYRAVIAQTSRRDTYVSTNGLRVSDYTLKEPTIRRLLKYCSVGKFCQISGQMNGLTHGNFFWVDIYSIVGFPWTPLPVPPGGTPEQVELGKQIFRGASHATCSDCHGRDAKGTSLGPSLVTGKLLSSDGSLSGITRKIRGGVPESKNNSVPVPAHGAEPLSDSDVAVNFSPVNVPNILVGTPCAKLHCG
jgi:hypothetical protein